jgi:hypothetical protein
LARKVNTLDYQDTYSRMSNDDLLRLTSQWATLTEPAQAALAAELEKRKLENEFKAEVQAAAGKPPGEPPSLTERVMFLLFVIGLPSMILLPRVWPESMRFGLYELVLGVSYCWSIWLIVWLVLRARRIQRAK